MAERDCRPVVITRPIAQVQLLAAKVADIGRVPVIFPLLEILPVQDTARLQQVFSRLDSYAMVVFVSPNAVDACFRCLASWSVGVMIGVVGEGSRLALARHGVTAQNAMIVGPRDPEKMDSEALLKILPFARLTGRRVLIVRGQDGRDFLTKALRALQIEVEHVMAYQRSMPRLDVAMSRCLIALLEQESEWIITSSEAMRYLKQMVIEVAGEAGVVKLQRKKMIVSHHRIAQTGHSLGFSQITLTGSGDERLIAALQSGT